MVAAYVARADGKANVIELRSSNRTTFQRVISLRGTARAKARGSFFQTLLGRAMREIGAR